jgi:class 3 adenylate cyclase
MQTMGTRTWNKDRAGKRIDAKIAALPLDAITIKEYVRDMTLGDLPSNVACRVDGVHIYADILNVDDILHMTEVEGEMCHRRTLRFLNLHHRAVHRILDREDAIRVDFHNQRLHTVVAKPYDSETARVHRAVALSQLIVDVLRQTGEDVDHPAALVRVGIDTGKALAVNNGRRGHREPLFLGDPANHAAKRAGGGSAPGIYLTNRARQAIGLGRVDNEDATSLTASEIATSQEKAALDVTAEQIVKEWRQDLKDNPIGTFGFSGHTPPFRDLDFEKLSVANSRRQDASTVYADVDGFTAFVTQNITTDSGAKHVVRTLQVLRSELDAVLHEDFAGRKVRFIGDCIHGLAAEGTAQTTDVEETVSTTTLCAAGMRSSFALALEKLRANGTDASSLGLSIGFEYGPVTATRLGMKGDLVRCSVSRGVLTAEAEQCRCNGTETAIGVEAYDAGTDAVRKLFGASRKVAWLDYDSAVEALSAENDKVAKAAFNEQLSVSAPIILTRPQPALRPHTT